MLISAATLQDYGITASDGDIGKIDRLFFDDEQWTIRYLVVDTGKWLPGRRVLISPAAVDGVDGYGGHVRVNLTREQIRNSPDVDTDQPVSRQHETDLNAYYGYGAYWGAGGLWGPVYYPPGIMAPGPTAAGSMATMPPTTVAEGLPRQEPEGDSHLRSTKEVSGYHVQATDGSIGHIDGFLIDDQTWAIRYLIVDTSNWPGGRSVLISPRWVREVNWHQSKVHVDADVEKVKTSPEYDPSQLVERASEEALHRHYGQPHYWDQERS